MKFFASLFLENKTPLSTHAQKLKTSGDKLLARYTELGDTPKSRELLRHVVAIERWGTNRLRVLLGEKPLVLDSSKSYYSPESSAWNVLLTELRDTRHELVELVPFFEGNNNKVAHNMMGGLSARAWLKYLEFHANAETGRLKG